VLVKPNVKDLLTSVLDTLTPLIETTNVHVSCEVPDELPLATAQLTTMRQALLNAITATIRRVPAGRVTIRAAETPEQVSVCFHATDLGGALAEISEDEAENLEMARELIRISGGVLELATDVDEERCFAVEVTLPAAEPVTVLALDDNHDALQLLHRYLSGTCYRLISTTDPQEIMDMAEACKPRAILLDIMLPGLDGWELLERLREHPGTCDVPVIVCTILPQENLARLLGAADFIRKPVSRQALLAALDRHVGLRATEAS